MQRCILLAHSALNAEWVDHLDAAMKCCGLELALVGEEPPVRDEAWDKRVFVAFHPSHLTPAAGANRAVIAASQVAWGCALSPNDLDGIRKMTAEYAAALTWPADVYVTDEVAEKSALDGTQIELFPGIFIRPPMPRKDEDVQEGRRIAKVAELFRHGLPSVGRGTEWYPGFLTAHSYRGEPIDAGAPIDIAGPPRALVKGPYFTLTPGRWEVTIQFSLDELGSGNDLRIEWGPPEQFVSVRARPKLAGLYQVILQQEWREVGFAEIIVELMNGCIGGVFTLLRVDVKRINGPNAVLR